MKESQNTSLRIIGLRPQDVTDIFKDRVDKLAKLREMLCDQSAKLICVIGRAGIGKTALVCKLCSEIESGQLLQEKESSKTEVDGVIYIDCREESRVTLERLFHDVGRLLGDFATADLMGCWRDSSQSSSDKVRFLLGKLRQGFYLLMMDNFERLLDDDRMFKNKELRTFMDLCLETSHAMRVIATSRSRIMLQGPGIRSARMLALESGLPESEAIALLPQLDPDGRLGLKGAAEDLLRQAVRRCFGLPKALETIAGILDSYPALSLERLLMNSELFEGQIVENLIAEHYRHLTDSQQRVLEALAIYNALVSAQAVDFLLKPFFPRLNSKDCLNSLVRSYMVTYRRGCDKYQLHPLDQQYAYEKIPTQGSEYTKQACHLRAAKFYRQIRKPKQQWHTFEDIQPQLEEFRQLERGGEADQGCSLINEIDYDFLHRWGFYQLIIQLRSSCVNKLTDKGLQADNFTGMGLAHHFLGEEEKSLNCHEQALRFALDIKDRKRESASRNSLGLISYVRGQMDGAIEHFQQAWTIAKESGDDIQEDRALNNLGLAYSTVSEYEKAVECLQKGLEYTRTTGNRWSEGIRLSNLGGVYLNQVEIAKARACFEEALSIAHEVGDRRGEAVRLRRLGKVYHVLGRINKARQYYHKALSISKDIGHERGRALSLVLLGVIEYDLGNIHEAIHQYEQALGRHRAIHYKHGECITIGWLGKARQKIGDTDKAISLYEDGVGIARNIQSKKTLSELLFGLGTIHHQLGHFNKAAKLYQESLSLDIPYTNHISAARLGILWLQQDKQKKADKYLEQALCLCKNLLGKTPGLSQILYASALVHLAWEDTDEALNTYQSALKVCSATGVVRDALDDAGFLKYFPKPVAGVHKATELLISAIAKTERSAELESEEGSMPNREQALLKKIHREISRLHKVERQDSYKEIIGKSWPIRNILAQIETIKEADSTVLITGETGTGKELVAQAIHQNSFRSNKAFVPLNMGAIPSNLMESELFGHRKGAFTGASSDKKGKFEAASDGTIFLDEIGDANNSCQLRLLRVLQERKIQPVGETKDIPVNVRVIVATYRDLAEAVREGEFREDLYYRINVIPIHLPALRERKEDIPQLVEHFLKILPKQLGRTTKQISSEAMDKLLKYDWPGNIRELRSCIETSILFTTADTITSDDITFAGVEKEQQTIGSDDFEKQLIVSTLRISRTVKEAIHKLKWAKSTFYDKVKKYGINSKSYLLPRR